MGVVFLFSMLACKDDEAGEFLPVDSTVQVEAIETILGNETQFILSLKTEKEYACLNYSLVTEKEMGDSSFLVRVLGVDPPEGNCVTALGPAAAAINLGELPNGLYELVIKVNSFTNKGTLEITADEISLDFPQQSGISVPNPEVPR